MNMNITQLITEAIDLTEAQIDTERRQIKGVVLIRAGMSLNKRNYSEDVLRKSVGVFEGAKAYVDHGKGARSARDVSGWYENVRYDNGKLIADRTFTRNAAGQDVWAVAQDIIEQRAPKNLVGLSINAVGSARKHETQPDALEIESITAALSVDDVDNAAAGGAYRESATGADLTQLFWEALTFEEFFKARPDYIERIQKEMKLARQDAEVKAAKAEADQVRQTLTEKETELATAQAEREAALSEAIAARRELALERALKSVSLPAQWETDLRESLLKAPEGEWAGIIDKEKAKAKSAGHRTPVSGADQQVNKPMTEATKPAEVTGRDLLPKPNEKLDEWQKRMAALGA